MNNQERRIGIVLKLLIFILGSVLTILVFQAIASSSNHGLTLAGNVTSTGTLSHKLGEWRLYTDNNNLRLTVNIDGTYRSVVDGPVTVGQHVAGTYDGTTMRLYVDGIETASANWPGTITTNTNTPNVTLSNYVEEYYAFTDQEILALAGGTGPSPTSTATGTVSPSPTPDATGTPSPSTGEPCTELIGVSQTGGFYHEPEFRFNGQHWQFRGQSGAAIDYWADPNYSGWDVALSNPQCSWADVGKVVLHVSGGSRAESAWVTAISGALATVRLYYPNVQQIVLMPVIGGPDNGLCLFDGVPVRASINAPVIDAAIASLVGGDVYAGPSPEVFDCSQYSDDTGHINMADRHYTATWLHGAFSEMERWLP